MKAKPVNWGEPEAARLFYAVRTTHPQWTPAQWRRRAARLLRGRKR